MAERGWRSEAGEERLVKRGWRRVADGARLAKLRWPRGRCDNQPSKQPIPINPLAGGAGLGGWPEGRGDNQPSKRPTCFNSL